MSRKITLLYLILLTSILATAQTQNIRYVKQGATGDGSSWSNASENIQTMIDNSEAGDEIWVAHGTYKPENIIGGGTNNRDKTFLLKNGVKLFGGFKGTETLLTERNLQNNKTTLSGDLGIPNDNSDNAYHVVVIVDKIISPETILDGFTITNGNANGSSNISISNLNIEQNNGGGFYSYGSYGSVYARTPKVESSPTLNNCVFYKNNATNNGGGFYSEAHKNNANVAMSRPILNNCIFNKNNAGETGGGLYSYAKSNLNNSNSSPTLNNCTFYNNKAAKKGGGLYSSSFSSTSPTNPNTWNIDTPKIYNSIFWDNTKEKSNDIAGADIEIEGAATTYTTTSGRPSIIYCITQKNSMYSTGTGIINNQNPLFTDASNGFFNLQENSPAINKGKKDKLKLPFKVYASGTEPILTIPSVDILGRKRIFQHKIDIGAHEFDAYIFTKDTNNRVYVKKGGTGDGSSWTKATSELSHVLKWAENKTINSNNPLSIWVSEGTYHPEYIAGGVTDRRNKTFLLTNEIKLYGGFIGNETTLDNRKPAKTILSGDLGVTGSWNDSSANADNAYHVVLSVNDNEETIIDGFTITSAQGKSNGEINIESKTISNNHGGGISNVSSSPSIRNCIFYQNTTYLGAGISNLDSSPIISNCIFNKNIAKKNGGGINNNSSSPIVINSIFFENGAKGLKGGGINNNSSSVKIYNSIFRDNSKGSSYDKYLVDVDITNDNYSTSTIEHSLLELKKTDYTKGFTFASLDKNIYKEDPLFINGNNRNFNLQVCSPAIASGVKTITGVNIPLKDIIGLPRHNNTIDMGVYENFLTPPTNPIIAKITPFSPADNAIDVNIKENLIVNFNTDIKFGTGNIKIYDATNSTLPIEIFNVINSSRVNISGNKLTINPTNDLARGKDYFITINNTTIRGCSRNYYEGISDLTTWNFKTEGLIKSTINDSFSNFSKKYGDADFNLSANSKPSRNVTFSIIKGGTGKAILSGTNNKNVKLVKAGTVTIRASVTATTTHAAAIKDIILSINKKELTINATANNKTYDGTKIATLSNVKLIGIIGDDTVNLNSGEENFDNKDIGKNKSVTLKGYSLSGVDSENYSLTIPTNLKANINQKTKALIRFSNISKMYGDADFDLTANSNSKSTIKYEIIPGGTGTAVLSGTNNKSVKLGNIGLVNIKATVGSNTEFDGNFKIIQIVIKKKDITVTAIPKMKIIGGVDPILKYTVNPILIGDDVLNGGLNRTKGEEINKYEIHSSLTNPKYNITYVSAIFTIYKKIAGDINKNGVIDYPEEVAGDINENGEIDPLTEKEGDIDGDGEINISEISGDSNGNGFIDSNTWSDSNGNVITKEETLIELVTIFQKWSDTIFFNNAETRYTNFEWYCNGKRIDNVTDSYYSSKELEGTYYVMATSTENKIRVKSNTLKVVKTIKVKPLLRVYPNPVNTSSSLTVETTVENALLQGTKINIYNMNGDLVQNKNMTAKKVFITAPKSSGIYIVRLLLTNGLSFSTNIIVK